MATFILVHGAYHGGWCWKKVVDRLEKAGHRALAPDLPGMAKDGIAPQDVTLPMMGGFIADLVLSQQEQVILVGHSFGGATISDAAERVPEALAGLVYVTAVLIPNGTTAMELVRRDGGLPEGVTESDDGALHTIAPERARLRYYQDCSPEDANEALSHLRPQPTRPMRDPLLLSPERFGAIPRAYVECSLDNAIPLAFQRTLHEAMPCDPVFTMEAGHSPFMRDPDGLAAHLIAAAEIFGRAQDAERANT